MSQTSSVGTSRRTAPSASTKARVSSPSRLMHWPCQRGWFEQRESTRQTRPENGKCYDERTRGCRPFPELPRVGLQSGVLADRRERRSVKGLEGKRLIRDEARAFSRRQLGRLLGAASLSGLLAHMGYRDAGAGDRCRKFVLSGGPATTEAIEVDDNLSVYVNGKKVFGHRHDRAGAISPITFRGRTGDKLRLVARDVETPCYQLDPLYLTCASGGDARRLTRGVEQTCGRTRPAGVFFDETYKI